MRNRYSILILLILFVAANPVWPRQKGKIRGTVIEKTTKQPLVGVNVQVVGTQFGSSTDANGVFLIQNLPEDVYKIKTSYIGYLSHLENDVRVIRNKTTSLKEIELAESALEVGEVIVTPGLQAEIETMPVSCRTYSREEIRRTAGTAGDVLRATSVLPGVSTTAGEFSTFSVRGGGPWDNLILVDNIPFDKISHFVGGSSEQEVQGGRFSVFTGGLIEDVTFSAGGYGPEYGRKAASVVDLTVKEGNIVTPTLDITFDPAGAEFNYDGPTKINDRTSLVFNARYYDYSRLVEAYDMNDFFYPAYGDIILKTTTTINSNNKFSVLGIYSRDDLHRDRKNLFASDDLIENDVWRIDETRTLFGLNWRLLTSKQSLLHNTIYFRGNQRDRASGNAWGPDGIKIPATKMDIGLRPDIIEQNQDELEIGWKSDFTQMLGKDFTIKAGIELFSIDLDYQTRQNGNDTLYTFDSHDPRPDPLQYYIVTTPEMVANHFNGSTVQLGAYISSIHKFGEKFSLLPGVRYEINGFNNQSTVAPRVQAKYHLNPKIAFNAAAGFYYQNPLYSDITTSPENRALINEQAFQAIIGVSRQIGDDFKVTIEGYYKKFDDLVVRLNNASATLKNQGKGWSSGLDFMLQKRFTSNYFAQMTYSWSVSKRNDNDGLGEYNAPYSQPHIFNLLGGYEINKKFFISAKLHCATGRPKHRFIVHENIFNDPAFLRYSQEITERNADRSKPIIMLDARVDYRQQLGRVALITFLDLSNILNRYNSTEERFSELNGEEKSLGFGFIPTFGFKLEL